MYLVSKLLIDRGAIELSALYKWGWGTGGMAPLNLYINGGGGMAPWIHS